MIKLKTITTVAAGGMLAAALWLRRHPSACPYRQRFCVEAPHPFITRGRLLEALEPRPGQTILEVGPGTAITRFPVAQAIAPGGTLHIFDVLQGMLDHTVRRARDAGSRTSSPAGRRPPAALPCVRGRLSRRRPRRDPRSERGFGRAAPRAAPRRAPGGRRADGRPANGHVYASWYSDGIRVIDTSDPRVPREVASFVPPAAHNPVKPAQRSTLTNTTQVWGVAVDEVTGLVYASDMNSGPWILRRTDQ
jgi:hypothetical protein